MPAQNMACGWSTMWRISPGTLHESMTLSIHFPYIFLTSNQSPYIIISLYFYLTRTQSFDKEQGLSRAPGFVGVTARLLEMTRTQLSY